MIRKEKVTDLFCRLALIDSPSFHEREMADKLTELLKSLDFSVWEDQAGVGCGGTAGNIYARLQGDLPGRPLLFSAHMDTVQPCVGKNILIEEDGTIRSDKTTITGADDLTGIVEILEAVRSAREEKTPHRSIEVLFTIGEEYFLTGAKAFDFQRIQAEEAYILDTDGEIGTAVIGAPTGIRFIANVVGKSAHAALAPETGVNAIAIAARAVSRMKIGRVDDETTASIGIIRGGTEGNIVPDSCFVEGETRSLSPQKARKQAKHMVDCFEKAAEEMGGSCNCELTFVYEAYQIPREHPVVARFERACKASGLEPKLIYSCGGSDNSVLTQNGIVGIVLAAGMHSIHSVSEMTSVQELCKMAELVERIITEK